MAEEKRRREILSRRFTPEVEIQEEWNKLVEGFADAQRAWGRIKELLVESAVFDNLDLVLQRRLNQVCKTTKFGYAASSFVDLLGIRGKVRDLLIETKEEEVKEDDE